MIASQARVIRDAGHCADQISGICAALAELLQGNPDTVVHGYAADGAARLARDLGNRLSLLADPDDQSGDKA